MQMKWHWLVKSRIVKTLATAVIFSQLVACGGGDGNSTSSGNGTETALANAVEVTGSVGDGPIIGATVEVYSADGELLDTALTDSRSSYTKKIRAKGKDFPLTIKATGGTDLVTGAAPDFDLYSLMMSPSQKIVNLNPYTMFVMKIAVDMPGGINDGNVEAAMASVIEELGYGIDPGHVGNLISDQVNESTVANVVKGSEVLSEMIRRTRDKYLVTGTAITANEVIAALAADMTDGVLDGEGVSGTNPRITAIAKVVSAQVLLEASRNKLKIGGLIATGMIDQAITTTQPGISPSQLTSSVRATPRMMKQMEVSLAAAQVLDSSEEISQLTTIVDSIPDNALAIEIDGMLPVDAEQLLDYPVGQSSLASDQDIAVINSITEPVVTPDPVAPANTVPVASAVAITGTLEVGQKLTGSYTYADADGDAEGASTYRWLRDGSPISGATGTSYALVTADQGASIVFEVTPVATAGVLTGSPVTSAPVGPVVTPDPVAPANTAPVASAVAITGTLEVGQPLTGSYTYADADGDAEGASTYRWLRDGSPISGATGTSYALVTADQGASIVFEVTPVATAGVLIGSPVTSAPVGPVVTPDPVAPANTVPVASAVAITGTLEVGQPLTGSYTYADADGDAEGASTYRWLRDGSPISGATGTSYALVTADQGASIVFEVTPVATAGVLIGSPVTSAPVGPVVTPDPVAPANTAPVASAVAITGTLEVGQPLTGSYTYADADGDAEGASTYRWLRDGSPISGATGTSYALVTADQGASIVFEVTPVATAGVLTGSPVTSAPVGPVVASDPTATIQCDVSTPNLACDLLGYWRFEEPVYFGRKHGVMDYSLAGHNATPINGVQHTTAGKLGRALAFNGTDEYITADDQALEALQSGSIATWVKTTNSTSQVLMQRGSGTQPQLAIDGSGHISFSLDTGSTTHTLLSDPGYNDGNWHHIVASWGTSGMQLFVDDSQVANNGYTGTWQASPGAWFIGAANAGRSGLFKGTLDEAAIWNRQLTSGEIASLYNAGNGQVISVGPVITQFQSRKMIYQPTENVIFDLAINSDQTYTDAKIDLWVEQEVDTKIHVYSQPHQIAPGAQQISIDWPLSGTGLNNNVNGHLARVTVKDSSGRIIAEKETLFDVVDNWWKVMRLANWRGSTAANSGKSDTNIHGTVSALRKWGFNTFELFHYSDPWDLDPAGDTWEDIDYAGRFIARDRVVEWGNALHAQGMKYLAYNETAAIQGPTEWQVLMNGSVWQKYYGDKSYFTPNLNFLSQRWADENIAAVNAFDFDGILMDSAYQTGHWTTKYGVDNNGDPMPQSSTGAYMHDWLGPAKSTVRAEKNSFAYVSQNAFPLVTYALNEPLDNVYNKVLATANSQDVWPYNQDVDVWSIEWDSVNTPSSSYPQEYDRMAVLMTSLAEVVGKPVLQWAFLTSASRTGIAYIRPKLATYYAARLKVHDHQTFYEGLLGRYEDEADSLQYAQYLRFKARYSYYLDDPDLEWIQQPENSYFTLSASKDLFWNRTVYHRLDEGKHEYIINVLNLPSNGKIEGQTEIPPTAVNVSLGINKSIGDYEVFSLDADDATLVPIAISTSSEDGSNRYYSLPSVRSWQVLVLKEK